MGSTWSQSTVRAFASPAHRSPPMRIGVVKDVLVVA